MKKEGKGQHKLGRIKMESFRKTKANAEKKEKERREGNRQRGRSEG